MIINKEFHKFEMDIEVDNLMAKWAKDVSRWLIESSEMSIICR